MSKNGDVILLADAVGGSSDLLAALIGAVVGGGLTIAGDVAVRKAVERRKAASLARGLRDEVGEIRSLAETRAKPIPGGFPFHPPLPTAAWQAFVSAGGPGDLDDVERSDYLAVYQSVEAANYLSHQAVLLFALGQMSDRESAEGLEREADRLSTEPYRAVVEATDSVLRTEGGLRDD